MNKLMLLLLLAEAALWYGMLAYTIVDDNRRITERELTASWKKYFKEEVQHGWIHYDGIGY